jgi:hypothetical protein
MSLERSPQALRNGAIFFNILDNLFLNNFRSSQIIPPQWDILDLKNILYINQVRASPPHLSKIHRL